MPSSERPFLSVVIRAYNEATKLEALLQSIERQEYPKAKIQIIVVDNGSTDTTAEVAQRHGATVVFLAQKEFTYPKSLNVGYAKAQGEFIFSITGHCIVRGTHYFTRAVQFFNDPKVAGVAGTTLPRHPYTMTEYILLYSSYFRQQLRGVQSVRQAKSGTLQNVCSVIRRSLWQEHPFNEAWAAGSEDVEWATWAIAEGHTVLFDPAMVVYHSHQQGLRAYLKQRQHWDKTLQPLPFNPEDLAFRKDINRS